MPVGDADRVRDLVVQEYFEPARRSGQKIVLVVSGAIHHMLGLNNRCPNACQALAGEKLRTQGNAKLLSTKGPKQSCTTEYTFQLL